MKKFLLVTVVAFVSLIGLSLSSFAQAPQYGGTLKVVTPTIPAVIGYFKEMGPVDLTAAFPAA